MNSTGEFIILIIARLAKYIRANKEKRIVIGIITPLIMLFTGYYAFNESTLTNPQYGLPLTIIFILSLLVCISLLVSFTELDEESLNITSVKLEEIKNERKSIEERLENDNKLKKLDIFDVIRLNLNQLTEYYTVIKNQSRSSFRMSVFAAVLGFISIIGGVWYGYITENLSLIKIASISSGIILEFISVAYYQLFSKTQKQLNFFFAELIRLQNVMISIELANEMTETEKDKFKGKIVEKLLEHNVPLNYA